jgi:hypothetical protein
MSAARARGTRWPFAVDSAIPCTPEAARPPRIPPAKHESIMGRFDRRNSMKMKRRRAQTKKKARAKKRRAAAKPAAPAPAPRSKRSSSASSS